MADRSVPLDALDQRQRADLNWIEELIAVGVEVGGVELDLPQDDLATAANPDHL